MLINILETDYYFDYLGIAPSTKAKFIQSCYLLQFNKVIKGGKPTLQRYLPSVADGLLHKMPGALYKINPTILEELDRLAQGYERSFVLPIVDPFTGQRSFTHTLKKDKVKSN